MCSLLSFPVCRVTFRDFILTFPSVHLMLFPAFWLLFPGLRTSVASGFFDLFSSPPTGEQLLLPAVWWRRDKTLFTVLRTLSYVIRLKKTNQTFLKQDKALLVWWKLGKMWKSAASPLSCPDFLSSPWRWAPTIPPVIRSVAIATTKATCNPVYRQQPAVGGIRQLICWYSWRCLQSLAIFYNIIVNFFSGIWKST